MLASQQRRQHLPTHQPISTLPSPPSSQQQLNFDQLSQQFSVSEHDFYQQKLLNDYLESQCFPNVYDPSSLMTAYNHYSSPSIRIQQSTPTPQPFSSYAQPMVPSNATASDFESWNTYSSGQGNGQSLQTPVQQRASSSIGSGASPYQGIGSTAGYSAFSNHHLPTPIHTPTQDSFPHINNYTYSEPTMAAHMAMKQGLDQSSDDNVPDFGHSARHSVSSFGQDSPATPHTALGDDFEDVGLKMPPVDSRHIVPKFERTYTDVANDTFYDPSAVAQSISQHPKSRTNKLLSPYRGNGSNDVMQRTLQRARNLRSQSPSSTTSRNMSPFRQDSPFVQPSNFSSPRMRQGAARAREQQVGVDATYAMKTNVSSDEAPKTMSPKDVMLDCPEAADDDSKVSLFPSSGVSEYDHQYHSSGDQYGNATQSSFDTTSAQPYRKDSSWATQQFPSNFAASVAGPSQPSSQFTFTAPSVLHGLPFAQSHYRTPHSMPQASEQMPDFPAHLTTMESSASEAGPEASSTASDYLQKPASSNADTGTYTCTYHGCTLRFETPQKLQKHKREGHRNANAAAMTASASMTSAALLERNSQAGPHKCERTNPTTGKPCNTVFSRPYDLTRHEDTIHNARKQKVRCVLCVEEKTFSRNDALTRHMRVVHPEVDFAGKHSTRRRNHD